MPAFYEPVSADYPRGEDSFGRRYNKRGVLLMTCHRQSGQDKPAIRSAKNKYWYHKIRQF